MEEEALVEEELEERREGKVNVDPQERNNPVELKLVRRNR